MKARTKQHKAAWVREQLVEGIRKGRYPVGSKLPPVSMIAKTFHVSPTTAFLAIRDLAKEEWVKCHIGPRGTIVLRQQEKESSFSLKTLVCLLRPHGNSRDLKDNFGLDILQGLKDEISNRGFRFIYHTLDEADYERRVLDLLNGGMVAGAVLDQFTPDETVLRLASASIPLVMFNREIDAEHVSCVLPDYERVGRQSLKHLLRCGYPRVAYYPEPDSEIRTSVRSAPAMELYRGFMAAAKAESLSDAQVLRIPLVPLNAPAQAGLESFALPGRRSGDWQPLGVLAGFDVRAVQLVESLEKSEFSVGRDIGIIGCGDLDCNTRRPHPFSTWRIDCEELGRETVRELLRRIEVPARPRSIVRLSMEFVDRGSALAQTVS